VALYWAALCYACHNGVEWVMEWDSGDSDVGVEQHVLYEKRAWESVGMDFERVSWGGSHRAGYGQQCCSLHLGDFLCCSNGSMHGGACCSVVGWSEPDACCIECAGGYYGLI